MKALNLILITSGKISEATAHFWVVSISGDNASRVYSKSPYKAMRYAFLLKKRTGLNISDNNTEVEYESETSSLSYSFARHLTQALQSHKLYLISPELPVGSSILITDIESELSDATNANNHVKFKWKPLRKQVPFTVPRLHNIFNQVYNNTFD